MFRQLRNRCVSGCEGRLLDCKPDHCHLIIHVSHLPSNTEVRVPQICLSSTACMKLKPSFGAAYNYHQLNCRNLLSNKILRNG